MGLILGSVLALQGVWSGSVKANDLAYPLALKGLPKEHVSASGASTHFTNDPTRFISEPSLALSHLTLRLSERRLYVYQGDREVDSYPVAIGRAGWQTPTGEFVVFQLQQNPAWEHPFTGEVVPPGRDNPLGARWIGFWTDGTNSIGFHGTPDEQLIGQAVSHGCVRMRNEDVTELYERVQIGTPVIVLP